MISGVMVRKARAEGQVTMAFAGMSSRIVRFVAVGSNSQPQLYPPHGAGLSSSCVNAQRVSTISNFAMDRILNICNTV